MTPSMVTRCGYQAVTCSSWDQRYQAGPGHMAHTGRVSNASELDPALRAWRDRVTPATAGLPAGGCRRAAGLRREELAMLSGVSADCITRLGRPWSLRAATPGAAISASGWLLASATLSPLEHDQRGRDDDQQYARYHVVDHAACLSISLRVATQAAAAAAGAGRASDRNHARWADLAVAFALISVESPPCDPTATSGAGSGLAGCFWCSFHSWPLLQLHPLRRKHITLSS